MNEEIRDWRGRLVEMAVDGVVYVGEDLADGIPSGLFQIVPDGSRQEFPRGAMRTTPADVDAAQGGTR